MAGIGESRSELLLWLNDLLKLDYTKVEQCGTGAAYCQIMDSIYGDLPMNRVNFSAGSEYEYFTNYKILQSCLTKHKIEKSVMVERLVKCRFQDNLEFLQWIKKYWTQNKDESEYNAETRRKGRAGPSTSSALPVNKRPISGSTASKPLLRNVRNTVIQNNIRKSSSEQLLTLQTELSETKNQMSDLEKECSQYKDLNTAYLKERDFYFGKLRDIEILAQSTQDLCDEGIYENDKELRSFLTRVQQILYATEEQVELFGEEKVQQPSTNSIIDEETF
ncbi:unnamed protein product [Kluyveromyces dobzhanskii CBS 2104]|uniref:WGS project CCBQ000000000 data, contig 00012 n=1 Tax=Kluyveromyces dobzhanskii CBS 2104 TaxID=1427455 RepID=A0A0A8L2Q7_9SACH|nr:unnamed protein product [Kluyveromyces dobzhanskii CBS 2104]